MLLERYQWIDRMIKQYSVRHFGQILPEQWVASLFLHCNSPLIHYNTTDLWISVLLLIFIEFTFYVWPGINKTPAAVSITNQATLVTGIKAKHLEWVEKNYLLPLILRFLLKHSNICRWWFIFQSKLKSKRLIRKSKKIFALVVSSQTSVSDVINFFCKKIIAKIF